VLAYPLAAREKGGGNGQLVEEIESADRVDIVMAFIRRSGIRPLLDALRRPYDEQPATARYAEPAPAAVTACYRTFCGTLPGGARRLGRAGPASPSTTGTQAGAR
jgi:hypothetical protein